MSKVIKIPEKCVIAIIGAPKSGKSTFANKYFQSDEIVSSDMLGITNQQNITVFDDRNISKIDRQRIINVAKRTNREAIAIILDLPIEVLLERNKKLPYPKPKNKEIISLSKNIKDVEKTILEESFAKVYVLNSQEEIDELEIIREKLPCNKKDINGPFDIIGDIHGCNKPLNQLLQQLGYQKDDNDTFYHPEGRIAIFAGDMVDKGTGNMATLKIVINMVNNGTGMAVIGNHDDRLLRYLTGNEVDTTHGMQNTIAELKNQPESFKVEILNFLQNLPSHLVLDEEKLVVVHAAIKPEFINKNSKAVREFCMYGQTEGDLNSFEVPTRIFEWTKSFTGKTTIVYGHTPSWEVKKLSNTYCVDTGCVLGHKLTALRYPEMEIVNVDNAKKKKS